MTQTASAAPGGGTVTMATYRAPRARLMAGTALRALLVFGAGVMSSALVARADDSAAITIGSTFQTNFFNGIANAGFSGTLGWQFTIGSTNALVSSLGVYTPVNTGNTQDQQVGIWSSDGKLLANVTIPAGEPKKLIDSFSYVSIKPIQLSSRQTYTVGAFYPANYAQRVWYKSKTQAGNDIVFNMALQTPLAIGATFAQPKLDETTYNAGFFGPNFLYSAGATSFTTSASGNWGDVSQWTPTGYPDANNNTANLVLPGAGTTNTIDLQTNTYTLNALNFTGAGAGAWNVANGTLILDGTNPIISNQSTGSGTTATISANLQLNQTTTAEVQTAGVTTSITGAITGAGGLTKTGAGTLSLSSTANTFSGATTINAGVFTGGANNAFSPNSLFTVNTGGTLDLGGFSQTIKGVTLAGGALQNGTLSSTNGVTSSGGTINGILGTAQFGATAGTTAFSGTNAFASGNNSQGATLNFAGSTTFTNGLTNLGTATNSGTLGGGVTNSGTFTNSAGAVVNGGLTNTGGVFTNSGTINGVSTVSGGTLTGTGTLGDLTVSTTGTLAPGGNPGTGTLTINGNLTLQSSATFLTGLTAAGAAGNVVVTGAAQIAGALSINAATGSYSVGQTYTLVKSTGALTGTFGSVSAVGLSNFRLNVTYGANTVVLTLADPSSPSTPSSPSNPSSPSSPSTPSTPASGVLVSLLAPGAPGNVVGIAAALDAFAARTGSLPPSLQGLYNLPPSALAAALARLAGETGFTAQTGMTNALNDFLNGLFEFKGDDDLGIPGGQVFAYAPAEGSRIPDAFRALAPADRSATEDRVGNFVPRWIVSTSAFGGRSQIDGNAALGTQNLTSTVYGGSLRADYQFSRDASVGLAFSAGDTAFSLANGFGTGKSNFAQFALTGRMRSGPVYVAGALAVSWHANSTDRTVIDTGDHLTSSFNSMLFASRFETGYRFAFGPGAVTPYAAAQVSNSVRPAYTERVASGPGTAALSFASTSQTSLRSELGFWTDYKIDGPGGAIKLSGRLAWVHDTNPASASTASFAALPGASFLVNGPQAPSNFALSTAQLEIPLAPNWTAVARVDAQFAPHSSNWIATGKVRYAW